MRKDPFVHLHLHTHFSILDGACRIDRLMDKVANADMPSVAITDHGVLYGAVDFYKAARDKGIKPILGCEAYITTGSRHTRGTEDKSDTTHHLVLLAENAKGFENLSYLITKAHLEGFYYKPRIDHELLAERSEGLIGLSACLKGEVSWALMHDDVEGAVRHAGRYEDIFGKGNFYLEVHDHDLPDQHTVNRHLPTVSQRTGLPIVATNDVHYLEQSHASAHEVLLCLQTQTVLSDPKRMRYQSEQFFLKSREEMDARFADFPGAVDLTLQIAERCNVELDFGKLHFPSFKAPEGISQKRYLVDLGFEGLRQRYGLRDPRNPANDREREIVERFNMELQIIERTGFINYFLVVWDFVKFAHDKHIPVGPGRGSGGGSIVAYALNITDIDPLRYGLIFERFLNPERVSPPDFDIDFCQARRGEVIEYVKEKYGRESVAQIITFGSLGAKTAIRDVGRVLEIPYAECDRLSKMVPDDPKISLKKALDQNPEFKHTYENEEPCKRILDYAFVLEGLYRHPGTHAAGVVIGESALDKIIPLSLDKDNKEIVTQYAMEPLGDIGLLKMDFLGLRTLTVIQETLDLIREHRNVDLDLAALPFEDPEAYALLNRGDTIGVFQLESGGMRDLIRRIGIDCIEDVIALIALYRPGPMNMLDDYVQRKSGKAKIRYDHALLEPILKETYGVMLYQEQVQRAANVLAGYSLGEADILRSAMGKKKVQVMEQQREKFIAGCEATNAISPQKAGKIFDMMAKFAGYGFNKAHSTGYAIISYRTAYLKANYPAEFMAAVISSEIGNFDKIPVFVNEAQDMELSILSPDINTSGARFQPEGRGVRYGLACIKNVGTGAAEVIVEKRRSGGPYEDLVDFVSRVDPQLVNKKVLESLVRSGACDSLKQHRARLFNGIDFAMARAAETARDRITGQGNLFDMIEEDAKNQDVTVEELPDCPPWPEATLLKAEKELLGVYLSGHPLSEYSELLKTYQLATIDDLSELEDRSLTRLGGIAAVVTRRLTKNDPPRPMAILQLEDMVGSTEVLVFPDAYAQYGDVLQLDAPLLVCGEVSNRDDQPKIIALEIYPLDDAPKHFCQRVGIHVPTVSMNDAKLATIKGIIRQYPGPIPMTICLQYPSGEKVFVDTDNEYRVMPGVTLVHTLRHELGEKSVFVSVRSDPCRQGRPERRNGFKRNAAAP
jgi:DNA polymerase-3 subunit alpha